MDLPESTARYLGLEKSQRREFLHQSYRNAALQYPQPPQDLIKWHLDKLKEYCERMLLLSNQLAKTKLEPLQLLLNSDACVCIQIAVDELGDFLKTSKCAPNGMAQLVVQIRNVLTNKHLDQIKEDKLLTLFQCIYAAAVLGGQCFDFGATSGRATAAPVVVFPLMGSRLSEIVDTPKPLESRFTDVLSVLESVTRSTA